MLQKILDKGIELELFELKPLKDLEGSCAISANVEVIDYDLRKHIEVMIMYEGMCVGCDGYDETNEMMLCPSCNEKLERDMIRRRDYEYAFLTAFNSPEERERIRQKVIKTYGSKLELIAEDKKTTKKTVKKTSIPPIQTSMEQQKENAIGKDTDFTIDVRRKSNKWSLIVNGKKIETKKSIINIVYDFVYDKYERYGSHASFHFSNQIIESIKNSKGNNPKALFLNRIYKGKTDKIERENSSPQ